MSKRLNDFPPVRVAAVAFSPLESLAAHRAHLELPFPLLADPDRNVYRQFGIGRGSFTDVWSLATMRRYRELLRRGRKLRVPVEDTRQLGGDMVIAGDGRLATAFRPRSPDQRPSIDQLLAAVERAG